MNWATPLQKLFALSEASNGSAHTRLLTSLVSDKASYSFFRSLSQIQNSYFHGIKDMNQIVL